MRSVSLCYRPIPFVEFGFDAASYEKGHANSRRMWKKGHRGLLFDGQFSNASINLHAELLTTRNVVEVFERHKVPRNFPYLSVDTDQLDVFLLRKLLEAGFRPDIMTVEYNANFPLRMRTISKLDPFLALELDPEGALGDDPALRERVLEALVEAARAAEREPGTSGSSGSDDDAPPVSSFPANFSSLPDDSLAFDRVFDCSYGASASAIRYVAEQYGYVLVGLVRFLDTIWVHQTVLDAAKTRCKTFLGLVLDRAQKAGLWRGEDLTWATNQGRQISDPVCEHYFRVPEFEWFFHEDFVANAGGMAAPPEGGFSFVPPPGVGANGGGFKRKEDMTDAERARLVREEVILTYALQEQKVVVAGLPDPNRDPVEGYPGLEEVRRKAWEVASVL